MNYWSKTALTEEEKIKEVIPQDKPKFVLVMNFGMSWKYKNKGDKIMY